MARTPPHLPPALPGLTAAAAAARPKSAASWSADEVRFALELFAAWNHAFRGLVGGARVYDKRHNRFLAIQFHRRNMARPPAERFTTEAVAAALRAYADDPANKRIARWKKFADFMPDAEEHFDQQLRRIGHRAATVEADAGRAAVAAVMNDPRVAMADRFAKYDASLESALVDSRRGAFANHPAMVGLTRAWTAFADRPADEQRRLLLQARDIFHVWHRFRASDADRRVIEAIAAVLADSSSSEISNHNFPCGDGPVSDPRGTGILPVSDPSRDRKGAGTPRGTGFQPVEERA